MPSSDDDLDSGEDDDDEGMQTSTPRRDEVEKSAKASTLQNPTSETLGTSPDHPIEVWNEPTPVEDLELAGPSKVKPFGRFSKFGRLGTPGVNPIDVEPRFTDTRIVMSSDGEDEASGIYSPYSPKSDNYSPEPDIYSPNREQPDGNKGEPLSAERPNLAIQSFGLLPPFHWRLTLGSREHQSATTQNDEIGDEPDVSRRKAHSLAGSVRDSLPAKSISDSTDGFDDVDEDDLDNDACFLTGPAEHPERSSYSETAPLFPSASRPRVHFDLGDHAPGASPLANPASRTSCSYRISCGMIDVNPDTQVEAHRTTQRPPSPSDAALAKNASNPPLHDHWSFMRDGQSLPRDHDSPYLRETSQKPGPPWMDSFTGSAHHIRDSSIFDVPDPGWPRYDDGPFSSDVQHNTLPALSSYPYCQNSVSTDQTTRKINSVTPPLSMGPAGDESRVTASSNPPVITDNTRVSLPEEPECRHKVNECHPARLNISDIVNPLADTTRTLKRKADEISSSAIGQHEIEQEAGSLRQAPPLEAESQELYHDDAQHRDPLIDSETSLSQSSSINSAPVSLKNQDNPTGLDDAGPARKKQKISSSSALSISKFVSGVLVGVAGAFAVFIATIPMSVQQEALQEIAPAL